MANYKYVEEGGKGQISRVLLFLLDGKWHTLAEIEKAGLGTPDAITARLRDLRKRRYGSYKIEKQRTKDRQTFGLWEYRIKPTSKRKESK